MNQEDTIESIKETFNVSLKNREVIPTKNSHKAKLIIAIVSTFLILAAATTLLIGYFKLDWFKNEIYFYIIFNPKFKYLRKYITNFCKLDNELSNI